MPGFRLIPTIALALLLLPILAGKLNAVEINSIWWTFLCSTPGAHHLTSASFSPTSSPAVLPPVAQCGPMPSTFIELPSVGTGGDTRVSLQIGWDPDTQRLCYVSTSLPEAPVLRVGAGDSLSITIANTLHDTGTDNELNCPIDTFEGEGLSCAEVPQFVGHPGPDGAYYPLLANQAEAADGTSNLHVHGMFVSPLLCSDNVLSRTIYPANWGGPVGPLPSCQSAPNTATYTYQLPANHPAGVYWYHSHRHGESEQETQMGLAGAIVVEDAGDTYRASIGVTDEVLLITDTPIRGCEVGVSCDVARRSPVQASTIATPRSPAAPPLAAAATSPETRLSARVDQVDQAACAQGASDSNGGTQLWTLRLNGAEVAENPPGFPPDGELLSKTMRPGQRQIFRLVNAAADSFLAPQLVLSQNGVETVQPLEVFARDGVGLADAKGNRHFGYFDVSHGQFVLPPAGRVEFVVHAPPPGAELYLQSAQYAPGCGGNRYPARRLLLITPAGTAVNPGAPDDSDLLTNEPSLEPYLSTLGSVPTVHRTVVFSEYPRGFTYGITKWLTGPPTTADYDPGQTDFYITETASDDGEVVPSKIAVAPFNMNNLAPQVVVHLHGQDSVTEQWLVQNSTLEVHDFHIHQIHFRDVTVNSTNPDLQPVLDTVVVPPAALVGNVASGHPGTPGYVLLNMTFTKADIGEFVFHCHILEHEDNGMMAKIKVVAD